MDDRKYATFTHAFDDPWAGEKAEDAKQVSFTFRFAKPSKLQVQRLQEKASKNSAQASRNLLIDTVHPEDKDGLLAAIEEYPGIATSFATAIIRGVGISSELGN